MPVITLVDCVGQATGVICDREKVQAQRMADQNLDHEVAIEELFEDQLACADLIVMSKSDLISEEMYEEVSKVILKKINTGVKMIPVAKGKIESSVLLGVEASSEDTIDQKYSHHESHHKNGEKHHHHDDHINSVVVKLECPHTPQGLVKALQEMVKKWEIYRIKGVVNVDGKPMRMVLQGVGSRFDYYYDRNWHINEIRVTSLVVIGADLDTGSLERFITKKIVN